MAAAAAAAVTGALSTAAVAATSALSAAERSYPASKVRGSGRECQAAMAQERPRKATQVPGQGRRPRGATPCPHAQGQGWQPRGATLSPRPGVVSRWTNPTPKARGGGREDQPHVQGSVAEWAQEGLEELSHLEGQEGWR